MENPWDARMLPVLRRHLLSGDWEVVHTHGMRANLPVRTLLRLTPSRPALFTTIHSDLALDYSHALKARLYGVLDRLSAGPVDGFFCVSADLARRLVARGVERARVHIVPPGIELQTVPSAVEHGAPSPARPETVGTVTRLVEVKDIGLLLQTAQVLRDRRPGVRFIIVGDGPERAALEEQAAQLGLTGTVEFRGEVRPAWPALGEFDVFALTSISEGVSLSVLEAMAAGLPVVATAVGGTPEIVSDEVTGYLVPRGPERAATATMLAARLEALLADPVLRQRMGAAGRTRAGRDFSTAAAAKKTLRFYERILAGRADHGGW